MVTAYYGVESTKEFEEQGFQHFLKKPVSQAQLYQTLLSCFGKNAHIASNQHNYLVFYQRHCVQDFNTEQLLFAVTVLNYKSNAEARSNFENRTEAVDIFSLFLQHGAALQVTVDPAIYADVRSNIYRENTHPELFDEALFNTWEMMEMGSWKRFKRSSLYTSMLQEMENTLSTQEQVNQFELGLLQ